MFSSCPQSLYMIYNSTSSFSWYSHLSVRSQMLHVFNFFFCHQIYLFSLVVAVLLFFPVYLFYISSIPLVIFSMFCHVFLSWKEDLSFIFSDNYLSIWSGHQGMELTNCSLVAQEVLYFFLRIVLVFCSCCWSWISKT